MNLDRRLIVWLTSNKTSISRLLGIKMTERSGLHKTKKTSFPAPNGLANPSPREIDLRGVQEVWAIIAKSFSFFLSHPFDPVISLARSPCCILPFKEEMHESAASHEAGKHVRHNCRVANGVLWSLEENVAAHNAIEIAPTDDEA